MQKSKTQVGILGIIEKFVRKYVYLYLFIRSLAIKFNIFEEDFKILKKIFNDKEINIIDVGASDGISANFFLKNLKIKKIYCYEPHYQFVKKLKKLKEKYKNVLIYNYGLSNKNKSLYVYIPYVKFFNKKLHLLTYTFYDLNELKKQIKLDFLNHRKILIKKVKLKLKKFENIKNHIDLVKIDVNGHELEIVKCIYKKIKINKPILIIENNNKIQEIYKILKKIGYIKYFNKKGVLKKHYKQKVLDVFFINKNEYNYNTHSK